MLSGRGLGEYRMSSHIDSAERMMLPPPATGFHSMVPAMALLSAWIKPAWMAFMIA
jgi:hypothetical protein